MHNFKRNQSSHTEFARYSENSTYKKDDDLYSVSKRKIEARGKPSTASAVIRKTLYHFQHYVNIVRNTAKINILSRKC